MDWTWIALILLFLWTGGGFGNLRNLIGDFYVDLKSKMDDLKKEIDGERYGGVSLKEKMDNLKEKMDNLEEKMDAIWRNLERIEESGMTEEESEEED